MEYKVVISDPKTGKSYQVDVKEDKAKKVMGAKIGDKIEGALVNLPGYKLEITGGSDKSGFPMKQGIHAQTAKRVLIGDGVGFKAKKGERARIRVHGEMVGDSIVQVNTKVVEYGSKTLDELLPKKEEKKEG